MPDSEAIDSGLDAYLRADATLKELAPGGVWMDAAPQGETRVFVVWSIQDSDDSRTHDRGGFETVRYVIKAVGLESTAANVVAVSKRLRSVLEGATFPVAGYTIRRVERDQRIAYVELDGDRRWQHRGAVWDVWAAPAW